MNDKQKKAMEVKMLFKKKKKTCHKLQTAVEILSELEPKKVERVVQLAKALREYNQKLDTLCNGRSDEVDKIEGEFEEI